MEIVFQPLIPPGPLRRLEIASIAAFVVFSPQRLLGGSFFLLQIFN